jgi:hypothetical protein
LPHHTFLVVSSSFLEVVSASGGCISRDAMANKVKAACHVPIRLKIVTF